MFNRVVAFLPGYASDAARGFDIASTPANRISDLIYSFAGFTQQGQDWLPVFPEPHDTSPGKKHNVAKLIALKTQWPALNIHMSIGGWNHSHQGDPTYKTTPAFSAVSATAQSRQAFVAACIGLFIKPVHPVIGPLFSGINIDWEYPTGAADHHNITLLLQEFRAQLDSAGSSQNRHLELSCCFGANGANLEINALIDTLDFYCLMTYLAHRPSHTPANQFTDFGAPLFPSPTQPVSNASWTIDGVVTNFINAGVPAGKLVIGSNSYARTYAGVANINHGLYQPYSGAGPGSLGKPEALEYKDLMANYLPRYESHWDDITKSAYLYSPSEQIWIMFDSVDSIAARAQYAMDKGLGGMLLWELSGDTPSAETQTALPGMPALIDAMPFGIRSLSNKVVLSASSTSSPALAFLNGKPFLASRHSNKDNLQVMFSSDDASSFGGSIISSETSGAAPALAPHNGALVVAWKGSGNDNLSVAQVAVSTDGAGKVKIDGIANKVILSDSSDATPALVSHDGRLFMAWKGSGDSNLSVMFSSDGGGTFGGKLILSETSRAGPALVSHQNRLLIAWRGSGNENLSVAEVSLFGDTQGNLGIEGLTNKVILSDTSEASPALASDGRRLFLAWQGADNGNVNVMFSTDNGVQFGGKFVSAESSDAAPALASDGSQVEIAWRGSGNVNLNVAQVAFY